MIHLPNLLLIGSADRRIGKTELACRILRAFASRLPVAGLKVTTIREPGDTCPRGGAGCGVCAALEGQYLLTEEGDGNPTKDTVRLRAAGARPVYWLRSRAASLEPAFAAALEHLGRHCLIVCESNSLRRLVEPGLFLMVRSPVSGRSPVPGQSPDRGRDPDRGGAPARVKDSAAAVWDCADRVVTVRRGTPGEEADLGFSLADLSVSGGAWALTEDAGAIVLAGGRSRRMGRDKAYLSLGGRPLIEHVCDQLRPHVRQILISAAVQDGYAFLGQPVVVDPVPGEGPLRGIAASLAASAYDTNVVVACDMPAVDVGLLRRLLRHVRHGDCAVPRTAEGRLEPLFAVYRKSALPAIEQTLRSGSRRIRDAFALCDARYVDLEPGREPANLNTEAEYREYLARSPQPAPVAAMGPAPAA